jgi:hypothetical protein
MASLAAAAWLWNDDISSITDTGLISTAEAVIGRPLTPVSYAGVARRTTRRRVASPEVGAPGVGGTANRGGPVNRVGRR